MSSKILLVAQRELLENVRTKGFWIGIFVVPLLLSAGLVVPTWLERTKGVREYAVVDRSGWLLQEIEQRAALPDLERVFSRLVDQYRDGDSDFERLPTELQEMARQIDRGVEWARGQKAADGVERLEERIVEGYASAVAGFAGTQGAKLRELLPEEATQELDEVRSSIQEWWLALPPEEAAEFGSGLAKSRYQRIEIEAGERVTEELNRRVADGELFAYFVIGEEPIHDSEGCCRYVSTNLTDDSLEDWFSGLASDVVRERRLQASEIDAETARWVQEPLRFEATKIGAEGEEEEVEAQDQVRQFAPVAFVYLLWISVFTVSQMLLTNTVEEKSNRLMEVLLSSVSPFHLMVGKILGIAVTGLAMPLSWVVFFYLASRYAGQLLGTELPFDLSAIAGDPVYIGSFLVYFLLGYLFYAAFLVGIGSVCNSLKEAQNLMSPITLLLIVPLLTMIPIIQDPNGVLARVLSFVPPFTPFVMMNRVAGPPTTLEYLLTTVLLLLFIVGAMWAAAKVFRVGVLMTGKPPKPLEILRWIRAPVGAVPERGQKSEASGA